MSALEQILLLPLEHQTTRPDELDLLHPSVEHPLVPLYPLRRRMTSHQLLSELGHLLGPEHHLLQVPDHLELLGPGHHLLQVHQTDYLALGTNAHLDCHQHSLDPGPVHLLAEPQSLQSYDADPRLEVLLPHPDQVQHHHLVSAVSRRNHQGPGLPEHHLHRPPVVVSHYLQHSLLVVGPVDLVGLVGRHHYHHHEV